MSYDGFRKWLRTVELEPVLREGREVFYDAREVAITRYHGWSKDGERTPWFRR